MKGTAAAEAAKIKGLEKVVSVDNDAYEKVGSLSVGLCGLLLIVTGPA